MTVSANNRRREYPGNGVAVTFPGPRLFEKSDLLAYLVDEETGDAALLVRPDDYEIRGVGLDESTVVTVEPPAAGTTLLLLRTLPYEQRARIKNQGAFFPEIHEDALDSLEMQIQQLQDRQSRSLAFSETVVGDPPSGVLPVPTPLALIGWDSNGREIINFAPELFVAAATAGVTHVLSVVEGQTEVLTPEIASPWAPQSVYYNGIFQDANAWSATTGGITFTEALPADGSVSVVAVLTGPGQLNESSLVAYTPALSGAVSRSSREKMAERVSVKDFGAVADGLTDVTSALQAAFAYASAVGGCEIIFPSGRYRKGDAAGSQIVVPSNTTIRGMGPGSVIFFDDDPAVAVDPNQTNRVFYVADTENVAFIGLTFEGTLATADSVVNGKQCIGGIRNTNLTIQGCTFRNLRHMATSFGSTTNAVFASNVLENIARDGARFTHSRNVAVTGNVFRNVSDDSVGLHSSDASYPTAGIPSGFSVTGNVFEGAQGIRVLGAKGLTVSGNTFRRCQLHAIHVEQGWSSVEGNTSQFAINITGNTILDTLRINASSGTPTGVINILGKARYSGALSNRPGLDAIPYAYSYLNGTDSGTTVVPGDHGIVIANNIIARTLPSVAALSEWGYGEYFDHRNVGSLWSDPAVTDATFGHHAISLRGPLDAVSVSGNVVEGISPGLYAVYMDVDGTANVVDFNDVRITNNVVRDCPGGGVYAAATGSGAAAWNLVVSDNTFDLDPFFRNADHAADNTWVSTGGCRAATIISGRCLTMRGNVCKNLSQVNSVGTAASIYDQNTIWSNGAVAGNDASNKGVRVVDPTQFNVIYDADPASATYGQVTTVPSMASSSVPTTGRYVQSHVVRRTTPGIAGTAGSRYVVSGWIRLTTGTGHVLNTDWAELRTLTGT